MTETPKYEVDLEWESERKGTLSSPILPVKIEVATPPDFPKGMPGIWSPEHLFVASVESCFMTTFLAIAENSKLDFLAFSCKAVGTLEKVENKFMISTILLTVNLTIEDDSKKDKALIVLDKSEKACLISNSVKTEIQLKKQVTVK
jgi:organic hydroperoxide reductase OsmC/OhrA